MWHMDSGANEKKTLNDSPEYTQKRNRVNPSGTDRVTAEIIKPSIARCDCVPAHCPSRSIPAQSKSARALAGQVAEDLSAGIKAQTESVLRQIDALLRKCGTDKPCILTATVYVADMAQKPQMDEAWLAWAGQKNPPARATAGAKLGSPDTLVGIRCTAAK